VSDPVLSRRAALIIAGVCTLSLLTGILLAVAGADRPARPGAGAHGFSTSAVGHRGLVEVLEALDVPVLRSRWETLARAERASLLVVAEPAAGDAPERRATLATVLQTDTPTLLVLPKWRAWEDWSRQGWVDEVDLRPLSDVAEVLAQAGIKATVSRPDGGADGGADRGAPAGAPAGAPGGAGAVTWVTSRWNLVPTLAEPQLLTDTTLTPLVAAHEGLLLGETTGPGGQRLIVLSDPDLLNNHGLLNGHNAKLAVRVIEHLRFLDGVVLFDETLHGFERPDSLWTELFSFPLVVPVFAFAFAVVLLLWATVGRFGAPRPAPPAHGSGVTYLIGMSARLLVAGGHARFALARYLDDALHRVARSLDPGRQRSRDETARWLRDLGARRGVSVDLDTLITDVGALAFGRPRRRQILQAARRVYRWRQEMLHGT
jgi:hypothetical protein